MFILRLWVCLKLVRVCRCVFCLCGHVCVFYVCAFVQAIFCAVNKPVAQWFLLYQQKLTLPQFSHSKSICGIGVILWWTYFWIDLVLSVSVCALTEPERTGYVLSIVTKSTDHPTHSCYIWHWVSVTGSLMIQSLPLHDILFSLCCCHGNDVLVARNIPGWMYFPGHLPVCYIHESRFFPPSLQFNVRDVCRAVFLLKIVHTCHDEIIILWITITSTMTFSCPAFWTQCHGSRNTTNFLSHLSNDVQCILTRGLWTNTTVILISSLQWCI